MLTGTGGRSFGPPAGASYGDEKGPNVRDEVMGSLIYGVFPVLNALKHLR